MPSGGMQASSRPLRWSLQSRTSAAIVATGLLLLLFTVSRRIWRGGGRKCRDPGGTKSSKKVKEKKVGLLECVEEEDTQKLSDKKVSVTQDKEPLSDLKTEGEELCEEKVVSVKEYSTEGCIAVVDKSEELKETEANSSTEESSSVVIEKVEEVQNLSLETIVKSAVKEGSDNLDCLRTTEESIGKESDLVPEESVTVSIIPEVCQSVTEQVVGADSGAGDRPEEGVEEVFKEDQKEDKLCLVDVLSEKKETGEKESLVEETIEPVNSVPLSCGKVVKQEEDLQDITKGETSKPVRSKRSIGVQQEEVVKQEEVLKQPEESVMQMNTSVMGGGKKKSGKKNKESQKVGKKEIDMKDLERVIMQNDAEVEEQSKCDVTGNHPLDSSGIGSPSMSNFPDNRSEGSSCGDSGKGRSDVTTPGGLEEEEREVSFPRHFSPPCSTSGPEEEEEEIANGAAGDGSLEGNPGEAVMLSSQAGIILDGSVVPMGVPYAVYPIAPLVPPPSVYEFVIPQGLVGRLIGKHGSFVNLIKARTSANIFIKTHPESSKLKVCAIEGTDSEIQAALEMIREKFPQRRFSSMTLEQVFFLPLPLPTFPVIPDSLQLLQLVEGVSNDVILSAMVSPSHFFLQQPTHPTYPTLAKLDMWMAVCYQDADAPPLPENVQPGSICAAPTMGGWYRAQVVAIEEVPSEAEGAEEGELVKMCDIRFVDYGGYERLPAESLRQIKTDFMTLPFQACECYLASVVPAPSSDENKTPDGWSMQAYSLVEDLTQAQVIQAQVVGHAADGLPLVFLYTYSHSYGQVVHVNQELVRQGLAVWAVPEVVGEQAEESTSEEYEQTADEAEAKAA